MAISYYILVGNENDGIIQVFHRRETGLKDTRKVPVVYIENSISKSQHVEIGGIQIAAQGDKLKS